MKDFIGRTAVITGAASGIGRGLVLAAASRGMNVVAADLDEAGLQVLADEPALAGRILAKVVDVADFDSVRALADQAYSRFGSVHLLVNNAGVISAGKAWEQTPATWNRLLSVNVMGAVHGLHAFVPRMLEGGEEGVIVNTASMAGLFATPGLAAYAASKHAIVGLSECLLYDLRDSGAKLEVCVLCPGAVRTGLMRSPLPSPANQMLDALRSGMAARGMDPAAMAEIVFSHIERGRFWIFPHPDMLDRVERRVAGMTGNEGPTNLKLIP